MPAIEVGGIVPDLPPLPPTNKAKKASTEKKTLTPKQVGPAVGTHVPNKARNEQTAKEKVKQASTAQVTKQVKNAPAAKDPRFQQLIPKAQSKPRIIILTTRLQSILVEAFRKSSMTPMEWRAHSGKRRIL